MVKTKQLKKENIEFEHTVCDLCGEDNYFIWAKSRGNTLTKCRKCGLVWTNPRIKSYQTKATEIYTEEYFGNKERLSTKRINARKIVYNIEKAHIEHFIQEGKILEVGCGTGEFLSNFGTSWGKYGCDIAQYALEKAKTVGINPYCGEFETMDFGDVRFDVIYFRSSLHHTYSPQKALKKAHALLKSDGILAICMSNNCSGLMGKLFRGHIKSYDQAVNYLFSKETLENYLNRNQFEIIRYYYPYWSTGYASLLDLFELCYKFVIYRYALLLGKENQEPYRDLASPTFYGNYINIFARKAS